MTTTEITTTNMTTETLVEWAKQASAHDRSGTINVEAFDALRTNGTTKALVPVEFGGLGASHADMGAILRTIARFDPAIALTLSMHSHLVAAQVWRHHHGLDASALFAKVANECAILVSTGASDWIGSNGTARKVEDGYRVSARKAPASGAEVGTILATSFRWDDAPGGPQVVHCSIPLAAPGVSIDLTWDTLGQRATGSHTVVLDDVFVADSAISLSRPADEWHPVWNTILGAALPLIMAAYLGIADAAVEVAKATVAGRSEQHVLQLLGEMLNAHTTAADVIAAMFDDADNLHFDNTDEIASRMLSRKTVASDAVIETVRLAIEATGGLGYTRRSDLERLYRDAHASLFHPLGRAKQTMFSGRVAQGLDPVG